MPGKHAATTFKKLDTDHALGIQVSVLYDAELLENSRKPLEHSFEAEDPQKDILRTMQYRSV
jgi:hypothetical protein